MAIADWRMQRLVRIETGLFLYHLEELRERLEIDPPEPDPADTPADHEFDQDTNLLGQAFRKCCSGDDIVKLLRYDNSARRSFYKGLHELRLLQARRTAPAVKAPAA